MANETKRISAAGLTELRQREHAELRYYNDVANNCTYGVGTLAHPGPCTPEELARPVTVAQVNAQLAAAIQVAEQAVRRRVRRHELTQDQFDALISYTYNLGAGGAQAVLTAADRAANQDVVREMNRNIYIHRRDANDRRLPPTPVQGLVNRRRDEAAPFQAPRPPQ